MPTRRIGSIPFVHRSSKPRGWRELFNGCVRHYVSRRQIGIGTARIFRLCQQGGQQQGKQGHFHASWKL